MHKLKNIAKEYARNLPYAKRMYHYAKRKLYEEATNPLPQIWNPENVRFFVETKAQKSLKEFLESRGTLTFSERKEPLVSIVLVLYNRAELTFQCLKSLLAFDYLGLEVIIIDNCSADQTPMLMENIKGVKYIKNKENAHFLKGTNQGAALATGKYLLLLNNDTEVMPGALEAALKNFEGIDGGRVGAVGAKLILPDGSLQEAGSLVWGDGTCLGDGRGDDPDRAPYQYRRAVDFCSGAFLLTTRELWLSLKGLDEQFAPAYYEEVDFCMRIWENGLQVIYDPQVVVHHFEFASSGKKEEAFALQRANQQKFFERHKAVLSNRPQASSEGVLTLRERQTAGKSVLWIDERIPHSHYGSGYPRAQLLIKLLTEMDCRVTLFPAIHVDGNESWRRVYDAVPRTVEVLARAGYGPGHLHEFLRQRRQSFDRIIISRPETMREVRRLLKKDPQLLDLSKVIYDAEAIFTFRDELEAKVLGKQVSEQKLQKQKEEELSLTDGVAAVMTVSEREAEEFRRYGCKHVSLVSHATQVRTPKNSFQDRSGILFVGTIFGDGGPNYDSMLWFCNEVLPLLRKQGCDEILYMVGYNQSHNLRQFAAQGVDVIGEVEDLTAWYDRCKVFVAPTRFSAGIPLKVVEAASNGVPCVISELLRDQLGADKNTFEVGSGAQIFAIETLSLLNDGRHWLDVQSKQKLFIQSRYSYEEFNNSVRGLIKL